MKPTTVHAILWALLVGLILLLLSTSGRWWWWWTSEPFATRPGSLPGPSLMEMSTQALDSAPTTSEVKNFYKQLLVFTADDIQKQATTGLRILADMRNRLYGQRDFRANLKAEDFLADWPSWMPPLDMTMKEPVPTVDEAVTAEVRILAYLQKNFPQESLVDEQTGSTLRNIVDDFGYRFVFVKGVENTQLRDDFLRQPLLKDWVNPAARA